MFDIGITADIHTEDFRDAASSMTAHKNAVRVMKCLALVALECYLDTDVMRRVKNEFKEKAQLE